MRDTPNSTQDTVDRASARLTLVTETWPPEINGVAMTLSRLVDGLRARNWQVDLVRPRQRDETADAADETGLMLVPGLPIPGYAGLRFGLPAPNKLQRHWRELRPDVVHVATEGPLGWSALKSAQRLGIPVTSSFHTNFHRYCSHYRLGVMRGIVTRHLRTFHNASAYTMAPNHDISQMLRQDGYRNVVTLGRGVDTKLFDPVRRCDTLRALWGATPEDPVVIHVGRLAPEKNLKAVLETFAQMQRVNPRARMVWVGSGPEQSGLQRHYGEHVFTGPKTGEELARHYASGDIFLFPSLTETFGNVVTEAMASGLAVVAFDYAAAALHVQHQHNGMLAPLGDQQAFMAAALTLMRDQTGNQLRRIREAARESMLPNGWDQVTEQFDQYLRNAMQGERHGE